MGTSQVEHRQNSKPLSEASTKKAIMEMLQDTAQMRAGKMDSQSLTLYSSRLAKEPFEDVKLALEKLAEMERREYESAIPDIGTVLALVNTCTIARKNREEAKKSQRLVVWKCPDCGHSMCGFPQSNSELDRRCQGIPKDNRTDRNRDGQRICGAAMGVFFDANNEINQDLAHSR